MSDCCSAPGLMPLEQGLDILMQGITPVTDTELVSLEDSLGRILASDIISPINVPSHDNSAMDGYAMRLQDLASTDTLPLGGQSFAGHPFAGEIPARHCIRIMTGASIPEGADIVIMQEQTSSTDAGIQFLKKPANTGANIRNAGEDIAKGDCVFNPGQKIKPQDVGLLASLGVAQVPVYRKLKWPYSQPVMN